MTHKSLRLNHYMIAALAGLAPCMADAAVRRPNRSDAYIQINGLAEAAAYSDQYYENLNQNTADGLPVRVADQNMADAIARGETYKSVGRSDLESCQMIYPNGEFAWATPTAGLGRGGAQTCVAVVELRATEPVNGGTEKNPLLARAYVAAGDSMKCNISEFPAETYTLDAGEVLFPADAEPTREEVVAVMNQEQKQNAAIRIATTTLIGAIGGNAVGKNEIGDDNLFGTGKKKMQSAAAGAAIGAAIGVGNAYGGKVAGDVILSTGVNAAVGATIGNMVATGDEVLRIEDCTLEDGSRNKCLWGMLVTKKELNLADENNTNNKEKFQTAFYDFDKQVSVVCDGKPTNGEYQNCVETELISVVLEAYPDTTVDRIKDKNFEKIRSNPDMQYSIVKNPGALHDSIAPGGSSDGIWAKIIKAGTPQSRMPAMISGVKDKTFGLKRSDWAEMRSNYTNADLHIRSGLGIASKPSAEYDINDFYPMYVSATDGGIIDFSNKARLKGTLIGAGAGGALGAFVGYQGAQNDIENRWVTAVREYKDSLQKIYCATGSRFLSFYNDTVIIPEMAQ